MTCLFPAFRPLPLNVRTNYIIKKMDVITETSLEALLQRAMDCRNKNTDIAAIQAFCGIIKKEAEGPLIASRLIASKLQSAEEWEALQGLTVLDTCMKNCGSAFHSEIGKFRFLNEMIKLVSPKFLGSRTPASVKNQVLKMMHGWTVSYPREHKIKEAYDMLIKQGVIEKDELELEPLSGVQSSCSSQSVHRGTDALFQDEEKVKLLQKLLHSKNPNDLQAANRLIKTMVREDERRLEIKSKRLSEMEHIKNNMKLLSEMLESYVPDQSSVEELELINELHQNCERLRQNVVGLASNLQDNDEFLSEILSVGDELDNVFEKYKNVISQREGTRGSLNITSNENQVPTLMDLSAPFEELVPLTPVNGQNIEPSDNLPQADDNNDNLLDPLDSVFSSLNFQTNSQGPSLFVNNNLSENEKLVEKNKKLKALEELDVLGKALLQEYKVQGASKKTNEKSIGSRTEDKDIECSHSNLTKSSCKNECDKNFSHEEKEESSNETELVRTLGELFVPLDDIKPSSIPPIKVIEEKNGISVMIHVAKDAPKEDVTVCVVTTLSKNPLPLTQYLFQAVVPKGCKLKLQPPSGSELPGHNPFLPPSAITQIMLISNPHKISVTLKCMISYTIEKETFTELGEVEKLLPTS